MYLINNYLLKKFHKEWKSNIHWSQIPTEGFIFFQWMNKEDGYRSHLGCYEITEKSDDKIITDKQLVLDNQLTIGVDILKSLIIMR